MTGLTDVLEMLGYGAGELMQFCTKAVSGPFVAAVRTAPPSTIPQDRDVWWGVNPCVQVAEGRPSASDITRAAALYCDLDVKPGGCASLEVCYAIIDDLSAALGSRPVVIIQSGHGLQPLWALEGGEINDFEAVGVVTRNEARALLRRWGRLVRYFAEQKGGKVDSVFDLARILRCPGSVNHKDAAKPVKVLTAADTGGPVTVTEVREALDAFNVAELSSDTDLPGAILSAPVDWQYGKETCSYVRTMVKGWASDKPGDRHPWTVSQATRISAAHRLGCFDADGHLAAMHALAEHLHTLVAANPRHEDPGEVSDALVWGQQWVSAMTDERTRQELEMHMHADEPISTPLMTNSRHMQLVPPIIDGANALAPVVTLVPTEPKESTDTRRQTDDGNAEALITAHGRIIRYCHERGRWLTWDGARWHFQPSGGGGVRELVKEISRKLPTGPWQAKSLSAMGTSNTIAQASTDVRVSVDLADLDADPWALNTPGGVVDLRDGTLSPALPSALHTRITTVTPDARAPDYMWQQFLAVTFGGDNELIGYLQRLVGYSATGHVGPHVLPFAYGSGGNGKGVFLEAIGKVLGDYATTAPNSFLMARQFSQHETEIARLAGARMVLCSEVNDGDKFDEAKVKQLTGGDTLTARFMRQDHFTFAPTHHLWLLGNAKPAVTLGGRSFWRRCRLIPFNHEVPESGIIDDLQGMLARDYGPAILAWIIRGAADYYMDGLREPDSVTKATAAYAHDQDTVARFVDECCHRAASDQLKVPVRDLLVTYEQWCAEAGEAAVTAKRLGAELRNRFNVGDYRSNGKRFYTGIAIVRNEPQGLLDR